MYYEINKKEESNYAMLLVIMKNNIQDKKEIEKVKDSPGNHENNQPLQNIIIIPSEIN